LFIIGCVLFIFAGTLFTSSVIVDNMAMNDLLPRYIGCEAFYNNGNPYSDAVVDEIQVTLGEARNSPYLAYFAYPAHLCIVAAPVWLLPYDTGVSLWIFLNLVGFIILPVAVMILLFDWHPKSWQMLLFVFVTILGYRYAMMTIVLAQFTGWVLFFLCAGIYSLKNDRYWLSAFFLAWMAIRPDGALIALGIVALSMIGGRHKIGLYWAVIMGMIWLITSLFVQTWEIQFIEEIMRYRSRSGVWLPLVGGTLGFPVFVALVGGWAFTLFQAIRKLNWAEYVIWCSGLVITVGLLLVPHTNPYTLVYAYPVFFLLLYTFRDSTLLIFAVCFTMVMSWIIFSQGRVAFGVEQVFFPISLVIWLTFALNRVTDIPILSRIKRGEKSGTT